MMKNLSRGLRASLKSFVCSKVSKMKEYLSHGGGVNSTALMILLKNQGIKFESIFVDHGGDYPETYEYINYLQKNGYLITILKPDVEGCSTIEEYCHKYNMQPLRMMRWCTDKFKLRVIRDYLKTPCIVYIGIDDGEKHRAFKKPLKEGVVNKYPLVELGIDRMMCKKIIRGSGLEIPMKSGCFFCPFARKSEIQYLKQKYPGLFERRKQIIYNAEKAKGKRHYRVISDYIK